MWASLGASFPSTTLIRHRFLPVCRQGDGHCPLDLPAAAEVYNPLSGLGRVGFPGPAAQLGGLTAPPPHSVQHYLGFCPPSFPPISDFRLWQVSALAGAVLVIHLDLEAGWLRP